MTYGILHSGMTYGILHSGMTYGILHSGMTYGIYKTSNVLHSFIVLVLRFLHGIFKIFAGLTCQLAMITYFERTVYNC